MNYSTNVNFDEIPALAVGLLRGRRPVTRRGSPGFGTPRMVSVQTSSTMCFQLSRDIRKYGVIFTLIEVQAGVEQREVAYSAGLEVTSEEFGVHLRFE